MKFLNRGVHACELSTAFHLNQCAYTRFRSIQSRTIFGDSQVEMKVVKGNVEIKGVRSLHVRVSTFERKTSIRSKARTSRNLPASVKRATVAGSARQGGYRA